MIEHRIVERPAFEVVGRKTWIAGPDNDLFGHFWAQCKEEGLFEVFGKISGLRAGLQTNGAMLGISRVENDPSKRDFYYMIAVEIQSDGTEYDLETYRVPASQWAVFECRGKVPDSIVSAEMYAFMEWLPASGFEHANAPEMEVYAPDSDTYCEFWLPIRKARPC
jgi:AraC family transcriptional regulator